MSTSFAPPVPTRAPVPARHDRFRFVDALRGLAALAVCCYHIDRYGPFAAMTPELLPAWCEGLLTRGWVGVQMFFVISGFVIAYSVREARVTPAFLGNFALRRSLRLDPAYWCLIAVALLLHLAPALLAIPSPHEEVPSAAQVAVHALYLQNVLGYENLSAGF